jgi:polar amino acid transport system substrate-binding protein
MQTKAATKNVVSICDDGAGWPPFTYLTDVSGKSEIVGFTVDVLNAIFIKAGITFSIVLQPWKRCLEEVEGGVYKQMLLNASYNKKRAEIYLFSDPIYATEPYYFYSKKRFPEGLKITSPEDLKKYKVCGLLGYNYQIYGLGDKQVDTSTQTFDSLIPKLKLNRCDLFIEQYEIIAGFGIIKNHNYLEEKWLGYAPLPYMKPTSFYMLFTRNKKGEQLQIIVNNGLKYLKASGYYQMLLRRYQLSR